MDMMDKLAEIAHGFLAYYDEQKAWRNSIEKQLNGIRNLISVSGAIEIPKPVNVLPFESKVRDTIMNATQFKSSDGFVRSDVVSLVGHNLNIALTNSQKQVVTYALSALCREGKIVSNGKKTNGIRYYFQRSSGTSELLPAGGITESSTGSGQEQTAIQQQRTNQTEEGEHL
jgi:hypothetical protein